jgi:DNA-binding MarR family transcriptional regulator
MQANRGRRLSALEAGAWRGFLRSHAAVTRALDRELEAAHGLSLQAYDVLVVLAEAPGRRLRMGELAEAIVLSQSGLTRLVDRLAREGLVAREPCADDRRGIVASLTRAGAAALATARPTHLRGVRARFLSRFGDDEQERLADAWRRILGE